ncbi:formaldehyde-activating enzyme [Methanosarcina horonobensis]|nr:formaldehyde-activating enzyme [Methanosarcina horonobensis]
MKTVLKSMVGEALIGACPEIAHIDLVIGPRGGVR